MGQFSSYGSLIFSIVVIRALWWCVFVCREALTWIIRKRAREKICVRIYNRTNGRRRKDKEGQRDTGRREGGKEKNSSRNTEQEGPFPGRCLAPNCMPESDCISTLFPTIFTLSIALSFFLSRAVSICKLPQPPTARHSGNVA